MSSIYASFWENNVTLVTILGGFMKDENDKQTVDFFAARPRGQPRKYQNNAEKQKAYRQRLKAKTEGLSSGKQDGIHVVSDSSGCFFVEAHFLNSILKISRHATIQEATESAKQLSSRNPHVSIFINGSVFSELEGCKGEAL